MLTMIALPSDHGEVIWITIGADLRYLPATIGREANPMTEPDGTTPDVRETLDTEIAEQWTAADAAVDQAPRARQRESASIRAEIADEETAAINAEIAENKEIARRTREDLHPVCDTA